MGGGGGGDGCRGDYVGVLAVRGGGGVSLGMCVRESRYLLKGNGKHLCKLKGIKVCVMFVAFLCDVNVPNKTNFIVLNS